MERSLKKAGMTRDISLAPGSLAVTHLDTLPLCPESVCWLLADSKRLGKIYSLVSLSLLLPAPSEANKDTGVSDLMEIPVWINW